VSQVAVNQACNVNQVTLRSFDSPLHYAAREGCEDVVQLLLERGARVNEKGYKSASSRPGTQSRSHWRAACCLTRCRGTPYEYAVANGKHNVARLLLQWGADSAVQSKHMRPQNIHEPLVVSQRTGWCWRCWGAAQDEV
jgi:hypothetical protein